MTGASRAQRAGSAGRSGSGCSAVQVIAAAWVWATEATRTPAIAARLHGALVRRELGWGGKAPRRVHAWRHAHPHLRSIRLYLLDGRSPSNSPPIPAGSRLDARSRTRLISPGWPGSTRRRSTGCSRRSRAGPSHLLRATQTSPARLRARDSWRPVRRDREPARRPAWPPASLDVGRIVEEPGQRDAAVAALREVRRRSGHRDSGSTRCRPAGRGRASAGTRGAPRGRWPTSSAKAFAATLASPPCRRITSSRSMLRPS